MSQSPIPPKPDAPKPEAPYPRNLDPQAPEPIEPEPRVLAFLRIEGLLVFAAAMAGFAYLGQSWWIFAAVCLAPDLAFFAYLGGRRWGALAYNLAHTYSLPLVLGFIAFVAGSLPLAAAALVWVAHIGADRALGYGLKLASGFHDTHLGRKGPRRGEAG